MTRDEIVNMKAGRELDFIIAENVLGYDPDFAFERVPWFSIDIEAAWQVVRKMDEHPGSHPKILRAINLSADKVGWKADMGMGFAEADTVELAICRAALLVAMRPK